jgi:hypothetical protein
MSMSWAGKIKNALEGSVDGSDVLGRLAATNQLESLRQQLADRRLDAEIASVHGPWRVPFALQDIAAPLWLAQALATLAQSLADAEASAHPDRTSSMAPLTRQQLDVLLRPLETLQSDISGMLADPQHRLTLTMPYLARPFAHSSGGLKAERVPAQYVHGLYEGATSLLGAVQLLAADYGTFYEDPGAPPWLKSGLAGIQGDLAAAQSRLDVVQSRSAAVLHHQPPDEAALQDLAIELWDLTNTLLKRGQLLAMPTLWPDARPFAPASQAPSAEPPNATAVSSNPPAVPPSPQSVSGPPGGDGGEQPRPVPRMDQPVPQAVPLPRTQGPEPTAPARAIPAIDTRSSGQPATGSSSASPQAQRPEAPRAMPQIGGPPTPRPHAPPVTTASSEPLPQAAPFDTPGPMPDIAPRVARVAVPDTTHATPPVDQVRPIPRVGGTDTPAVAGPTAPAKDLLPGTSSQASAAVPGRRVERKDRWLLSGSGARHRLRALGQEDQAERDLAAFWEAKQWSLAPAESEYLTDVASLLARGAVTATGRSQELCPFAPIYRVGGGPITLLGRTLAPGTVFSFEYHPERVGLLTNLSLQAGVPDR